MTFNFLEYLRRERIWSLATFGPGAKTESLVDHIRKELVEIEDKPLDLEEWIDVAILALDGAWRTGATPDQVSDMLIAKLSINQERKWPDWRTADQTKAFEHIR